jgi:hypothetical protein
MNFSLLPLLTASLLQKLDNVTEGQLLSALESLSAMPASPYEQMKVKYFGRDYVFPSIKNLETPTNFDPRTCYGELTGIADSINVECGVMLSAFPETYDSDYVEFNQEIVKKGLEFTELVKTMTIDDINTKPVEMAKKLTTYFIKSFTTK